MNETDVQTNVTMEQKHGVGSKGPEQDKLLLDKNIKFKNNGWPIEPGHQTMDLSLVRSVPLRWALTKPAKIFNFKIEDSHSGSYVSHRKKEESKYIRKKPLSHFY